VPHVAAVVAAEKGLPVERLADITTRNFEQLFGVQVPAFAA
jgi:Tat protein secretion system quality control protein TatD with DNase activity